MLTDDDILRLWSGDTTPTPRPVLGQRKVLAFARAVEAAAYERAAQAAGSLQDVAEEARAGKAARERAGEDDELNRLQHHTTVAVYNAGIRKCAAAIRTLAQREGS